MELRLLSNELLQELEGIRSLTFNTIKRCDLSIVLCRNLLSRFKKVVVRRGFTDERHEIEFFKELKQIPLSELVHYFELRSIELRFPKGNIDTQRKYLQKKLNKFNRFFVDNLDFVQYIEQGKTYLDDHYFTMAYFDEYNITHSKFYYRDPEFSSSHDLLLAKLRANQKIMEYLEHRMGSLGKVNGHMGPDSRKRLQWTGTKTDLTELGYGLKYSGSINHGNASISDIVKTLGEMFHFEPGDPYKNFSDMSRRKKDRTKFIDDMSFRLRAKMDDGNL